MSDEVNIWDVIHELRHRDDLTPYQCERCRVVWLSLVRPYGGAIHGDCPSCRSREKGDE